MNLPHRLALPHVALSVAMLRAANDALADLAEALAPVPIEEQGNVNSFAVFGYRATCRHFIALLAPADGFAAPMVDLIRGHVWECETTWPNPEGLQRAAFALAFASAGLQEAIDAVDQMPGSEDWREPLVSAMTVVDLLHESLRAAIAGRVGPDRMFSDN
jgi:hypothetical protein